MDSYHVGDTHIFTSYTEDVVHLKGNRGSLDLVGTITVNGAPIGTGSGNTGATGATGPEGPQGATGATGPVGPLDDLSDVTITNATAGDILVYGGGGQWVNTRFINQTYTENNLGSYDIGMTKQTSVIPIGSTGASVYANFTCDLTCDPDENNNNYESTLIALGSNVQKSGSGSVNYMQCYNLSCGHNDGLIGNLVGVNVNMYKDAPATTTDAYGESLALTFKSTNSSNGMNVSLTEKGTPTSVYGISENLTTEDNVNSFVGMSVNMNSKGSTSYYGYSLNMAGTAQSFSDTVGVRVDMNQLNIVGDYKKKFGLSLNECFLQCGAQYPLTNDFATISGGNPVDSGHLLAHQVILTEDTTECDYIGTNPALVVLAEHNYTSSSSFGLGITPVGYVGQMAVKTGKTVDKITMSTAGMVLLPGQFGGSDSGLVTDLTMYGVKGTIPAGGNTKIMNVYGLKIDAGLNYAGATNAWGVYDDSDAENYFKKCVSIVDTKVDHTNTGVQIGGNKHLVFKGSSPSVSGADSYVITGNDNSGKLEFTTDGSGPHNIVVSFNNGFENEPSVVLTPYDSATSSIDYYVVATTSGFTVSGNFGDTSTYKFYYVVIGVN